jgi:hypothetical protein
MKSSAVCLSLLCMMFALHSCSDAVNFDNRPISNFLLCRGFTTSEKHTFRMREEGRPARERRIVAVSSCQIYYYGSHNASKRV